MELHKNQVGDIPYTGADIHAQFTVWVAATNQTLTKSIPTFIREFVHGLSWQDAIGKEEITFQNNKRGRMYNLDRMRTYLPLI